VTPGFDQAPWLPRSLLLGLLVLHLVHLLIQLLLLLLGV
jgi:hypothetical protein